MTTIERLTITLPNDMAAAVKAAVTGGAYASTSEVVRDALRDWQLKSEIRRHKLESLRQEIAKGIDDMKHNRLVDVDADEIMELGRRLSAKSDPSD